MTGLEVLAWTLATAFCFVALPLIFIIIDDWIKGV